MPSSATIGSSQFTVFGQGEHGPGKKARSSKVGSNFDIFRGHLVPVDPNTSAASDATHDLGSSEHQWRNVYFSGSLFGGGAQIQNLTELSAVTEESITKGDCVAIFTDSGTSKFVKGSLDFTNTTFHASTISSSVATTPINLDRERMRIIEINPTKFVVTYVDFTGTNFSPKAICGSIVNRNLTFGAAVTLDATAATTIGFVGVTKIGSSKVAFTWQDSNNYRGVIGTITGNVIGLGAVQTLISTTGAQRIHPVKLTDDRFGVVFWRGSGSWGGVGLTVNGTVITAGTIIGLTNFIAHYTVAGPVELDSSRFGFIYWRPSASANELEFVHVEAGSINFSSSSEAVIKLDMSISAQPTAGGNCFRPVSISQNMFGYMALLGANQVVEYKQFSIHKATNATIPSYYFSEYKQFWLTIDNNLSAANVYASVRNGQGMIGYNDNNKLIFTKINLSNPGFTGVGRVRPHINTVGTFAVDVAHVGPYVLVGYSDWNASQAGKIAIACDLDAVGVANTNASVGVTLAATRIGQITNHHTSLTVGNVYYQQLDGTLGPSPEGKRMGIAVTTTGILVGS